MKKDWLFSAITMTTLTILAIFLVVSVVYLDALDGKEEKLSKETTSEKETPVVTYSSGTKTETHLSPAFPDNRAVADSTRGEAGRPPESIVGSQNIAPVVPPAPIKGESRTGAAEYNQEFIPGEDSIVGEGGQPHTIIQDPRNVAPSGGPIPIEGGRPPATSGNSAEFFSGGNSASGQGGQRTPTGGFTQQSRPGFESAPREGDRSISSITLAPGGDPLCLEAMKAIETARRVVHCSMIRECRDFPGVVFDEERVWSRINGLPDVGPEVGAEIIINNTAAVTVERVEAYPAGGNFDPTQPGVTIVVKITAVAFGSGDTSCRREATHKMNTARFGGK